MLNLNAETLRAWIAGREAAEVICREEIRASKADPEASVGEAASLQSLWIALHGWPPPVDDVRRREEQTLRFRWDRLRALS